MNTLDTLKAELRPLAGITIGLLLITAVAYPLAITGIGQAFFNRQANGSLIEVDGEAVGSSLVGQVFVGAEYFHGRPSAAGDGYDAASSSGSNLGPTSATLLERIEAGAAEFRSENGLAPDSELPADAVTASSSGLDPHISPATARLQVARIADARGASEIEIRDLVDEYTEDPFLGFIGKSRVNVLKLNIALDERFPLEQ
jgi:K+-transporting ATPase ATPase C chain